MSGDIDYGNFMFWPFTNSLACKLCGTLLHVVQQDDLLSDLMELAGQHLDECAEVER